MLFHFEKDAAGIPITEVKQALPRTEHDIMK